ncbi:patatin-like phospholipase family protein [Mangrovitalea sediminis]|uniref:patatin-like phospholipase family protein n=1 Tax=Mangrovitalea sediminis TaxID=1982043 RepID=UPI000BE58D0F|nr:patatin-like phospholipase family protein [Mangrovitalea sediminis]
MSDTNPLSPFVARPGNGKTVALVLGSGGARGYAHIGVIEVLLERGYDIIAIAGCSMGALVGGVYAAGKLQDYKDWVTGLGQFDVLKLLDISLSLPGAIRGEKIFAIVHDLIGDIRIEDLPVPYTAVATDLLAHKEIWFQEGSLHQAIRASVAIPSLLTPVLMGGRVLVDGGLLNPLPIIPTIAARADQIIAVNLSGDDAQPFQLLEVPSSASEETDAEDDGDPSEEWLERIREKASRIFDRDTWRSFSGKPDDEENARAEDSGVPPQRDPTLKKDAEDARQALKWQRLGLGKFDIMNLAFETMQSSLTQYKLAGYPPDILIEIPKHSCKTFDYHKAPEMIQLGRECAEATLDRLLPTGKSSLFY